MRLQILADDERVDYAICAARVKKFLSEAEHSSIDLLKVRYLLDRAGALFVCEQATIVSMRRSMPGGAAKP